MRLLASILALSLVSASVSLARADAPTVPSLAETAPAATSARSGVVVIAVADGTRDATWPVALAVYASGSIRPGIEDRDARVLAGEAPAEKASTATKELAELRAKVKGNDAASRVILAEIARRTRARAILVVFPPHDQTPTEAQVYDAADDHLDASLLRADHRDAGDSWAPVVELLRGRYAKSGPSTPSPATSPEPEKKKETSSSSFLSSPWFWGAIAGAAAGAVAVYLYAHESSSSTAPAPVHFDWSH